MPDAAQVSLRAEEVLFILMGTFTTILIVIFA